MTRRDFERLLRHHGFIRERTPAGAVRWHRAGEARGQYCVLENVRQGDWRLFLAVGLPPADWPMSSLDRSASAWVEAESPWFAYFNDLDPSDPDDARFDNKERALQRCADWLFSVGMKWLDAPESKSPPACRTDDNVLVRFNGGDVAG